MNQSFIINDDYQFDKQSGCWCCTAMLAGNRITIFIKSDINEKQLTQNVKFDWECIVEDWLEENEPNTKNEIIIELS